MGACDMLSYPDPAGTASGEEEAKAALDRVGLGRLVPCLDKVKRWDKELTLEETPAADPGPHAAAPAAMARAGRVHIRVGRGNTEDCIVHPGKRAKQTAVLSIGRHHPNDTFYQRFLNLETARER